MQLQTITITKVINGGYGFGRLATGQVMLVRHLLPGETANVTIEEKKKNHLYGKAHQIIKKHPGRRDAPCKYYGKCGGCDLQLCDYNSQLSIKKEIIEDLFLRQSHNQLKTALEFLANPIGSPLEFVYRQRIRLQVDEQNSLGFRRFRSHEIIPIDCCLLAHKNINIALLELLNHKSSRKLTELSSEVELQLNPVSGNIICTFHFSRKPRPADIENARLLCRDIELLERIFFEGTDFPIQGPYATKEGEKLGNTLTLHYPGVSEDNSPLTLSWEVGGFCQVNLEQNVNLITTVLEFCQTNKRESILDLFCGMGNFSIPLASRVRRLFGIEGQGSAIRSAKANAARAGLTNCHFQKNPIHSACPDIVEKGQRFDCVVIDPPRQGAPELASQLATICSKRLVYISCDPATLCRDLVKLTAEGFSIKKIQPVDMFPQTHHIEIVVLLEK